MDTDRYSRQILFKPIGQSGQASLSKKHVLVVGAGALGTQGAEMLVRAGVGKLTIVDRDYVEWSNLQRQLLYTEVDAEGKMPKAIASERRLKAINSDIEVKGHVMDVTANEMLQLLEEVDLVIDATDNFDIRMIMNDACVKAGVPWIFGSCVGSYGMSYTVLPDDTPCLHCILEKVPMNGATCDTAGIIQPTVSQVVVHQTAEALKILTGNFEKLRRKLVSFDIWENQTIQMNVDKMKRQDCPSCGEARRYPFLQFENQTKTAVLCGRDAVQIRPTRHAERNLSQMAEHLEKVSDQIMVNPFLLSIEKTPYRFVLFKDGRALIHGTNDIEEAKKLYYQYLA